MALYHSAKGSVNYTVVGNPTIVDGVASGFSKNNYLTLPVPTGTVSSFEFVVDFTTGSKYASDDETNSFDCVIGQETNRGTPQIEVATNENNHVLQFLAAASGSSIWDVDMRTSVVAQLNTRYVVKFIWDGTNTYCYYKNNDEWILLGTQPLTSLQWNSKMRIGTDNATKDFFRGSINLNNTYIKVNGQPWFGVCPVEVKKHQIIGPVGYTVVGSPTINNGVVSGFSANDYLTISTLQTLTNTEFGIVFTTSSNITSDNQFLIRYILRQNTGQGSSSLSSGLKVENSQLIYNGLVNKDTFTTPTITTSIQANTKYKCKFIYDGSKTEMYLGIYGQTLELVGTAYLDASLLDLQQFGTIFYGYGWSNKVFTGSIDLNETYIKVNGKLWFYQPAPTKYIVKDGKLVWADPRIYLQSQSSANEVRPYIDTGYIPTVNTTYEWTAQFLINTGFMFGANSGDVIRNRVGHNYASGKDFVWTTIGYQSKAYEVGRTFFSKYTSYTDADGYCYLNGTNVGKMTAVAGETTKHMWLFGASANDDSETYVTSGASGYSTRIYNFKLYESGLLVRDFVPVPAGLVIGNFTVPSNGMFDIVNQQFYGKVGSSLYEFTIGRDA